MPVHHIPLLLTEVPKNSLHVFCCVSLCMSMYRFLYLSKCRVCVIVVPQYFLNFFYSLVLLSCSGPGQNGARGGQGRPFFTPLSSTASSAVNSEVSSAKSLARKHTPHKKDLGPVKDGG